MIHIGRHTHSLDHRFERKPGFEQWTLSLMLSGSSRLEQGDRETLKRAPCITLTPPDTPYRVSFGGVGKTWSEMWVFFPDTTPHAPLARQLLSTTNSPLYLPLAPEIAPTITTQFELLFTYDQWQPTHSGRLLDQGLSTILITLGCLSSGEASPPLRQAAALLSDQLDRPLSLNQVARHVGMSLSSLSHRFKESFGCPPMRYRETQRLKQAAALLLATDLTLQQLAPLLGFADAFHFSRRFRHHFQQSPSQYRRAGSP